MLIGNKCDLTAKRQVALEEGQELARALRIDFMETSAKAVTNVEVVFATMAENILARITHQVDDDGFGNLVKPRNPNGEKVKHGGCCG